MQRIRSKSMPQKTYKRDAALLVRKFQGVEGEAGYSWFGGRPKLPAGVEWPCLYSGEPLHFVAQIDCRELIGLTDLMLPYSGQLAFFTGPISEDDGIKVLHVHDGTEREEPEGLLPINCKLSRERIPSEIIKNMPERFRYGLSFQHWPLVIKAFESRFKLDTGNDFISEKLLEETTLATDSGANWIEGFEKSFEFYPEIYQPDGSGAGRYSLGDGEEYLDTLKYGYIPKNTNLWPFTNEGLAHFIRLETGKLLSEFPYSTDQEDSKQFANALMELIEDLYSLHESLMDAGSENTVSPETVLKIVDFISHPDAFWQKRLVQDSFSQAVLADVARHVATDRLNEVPEVLLVKLMPALCGRTGNNDSIHQIGGFGLNHYDSGYKNINKALLLQLDCDDAMGWLWGDCDSLKFWISHEHLKERNFDRVRSEE